jgi:Mrp family chromosome partitioning ATPase
MSIYVLKKQAKNLARLLPEFLAQQKDPTALSACQELMAKAAGYPNFHEAEKSEKAKEHSKATEEVDKKAYENLLGSRKLAEMIGIDQTRIDRFTQTIGIVCGKSGTGKSVWCIQKAVSQLEEGWSVTIIDSGGSYRHICELVGGTYYRFKKDGSFTQTSFGNTGLRVLNADDRYCKETVEAMEKLCKDHPWDGSESLHIIDGVPGQLFNNVNSGGSLIVTTQNRVDAKQTQELKTAFVQVKRWVRTFVMELS